MQETKRAGHDDQPFEKPRYIIPEKPLQVNLDNIPSDMKARPQWCLWNLEWKKDKATGKPKKDEKPTKVPYQLNGKKAKSNDPNTWSSFDDVVKAFRTGKFHGVLFALSENDKFTAIDFDNCIDENGTIKEPFQTWFNDINSYSEVSQSGEGIHIICEGSIGSLVKSTWGIKKFADKDGCEVGVEVYDKTHFITMNGKHIIGSPTTIENRQSVLNTWVPQEFPDDKKNVVPIQKTNTKTNIISFLTDEQVIEKCLNKYGQRFTKLYYDGDISDFPSHSESDMSLINLITQYTQEYEQIERIFRGSSLYRENDKGNNYLQETILKNINNVIDYRLKNQFPTPDEPQYDEWFKLMEPTYYGLDQNGKLVINKEVKNKKTLVWEWVQIPLCNFVARIDKEITEDDGIETTKKIELVGMREGAIPLITIQVPIKDFESLSWVVEKWGTLCNMEPEPNVKNKVRYAIQELSKQQQQEYIYTHLGWRKIAGKWNYLHAGGSIGTSGVKVNVEQNNLTNYALPEPATNLVESIKASIELKEVAQPHISLSLLAMVGLAPLCEPFRKAKNEPAFILWLVGLSGSRKSTIAGCVLNHFGDFGNKSLPATFKDTVNALEKKAYLVKDSLLVIDDFHPTDHERKPMEQKAEYLLRGYGDRVGKERMKQDTSIRKGYAPKGICIVTGESLPMSSRSGLARLLAIDIDKNTGVKNEVLDKFQTSEYSLKLRESYRGYIEWLLPQLDVLPELLNDKFKVYRKAIQNTVDSGQHGRLNETIVWLLIGLSYYTKYALELGAITDHERKQILSQAKKEFLELGSKHTETIQEEKKSSMFCVALQELIATQQVSIHARIGDIDLGGNFADHIGYYDTDYLYLFPESTKGIIEQFYNKQNRTFNISLKMLYRELTEEKIMIQSPNGKATQQHKIKGRNQRFLVVKRSILDDEEIL